MRIFVLFLYFFQQLVAGVVLPGLPSGTLYPEGTFFITNQKQNPSFLQYIDQESEEGEEDEQVDYSSATFGTLSDINQHDYPKLLLVTNGGKLRILENRFPQSALYLLFENLRI